VANERLRQAIKNAGLTVDDLAQAVQVDIKTARRWLSGRVPYSRHRTRVARALGVTERDLWPQAEIPDPAAAGKVELVAAFPQAADAAPSWPSLLDDAREQIWLLDFTLIDILASPGIPELLAAKASTGCEVRLLISYATRARLATDTPIDEPYPDPEPQAVYDIARARGHIEPLLEIPGIEARKFAAMRFNTTIRADEQMLITHHLWGTPTDQAPLIHLRRQDQPGLFAQYARHYQSIWQHASHPIAPEPNLFPPPDANPDHYDGFLFDDAPPDPTP
jgi:transcriptional regulator with XRE-family HTH domain